MKQSRKLWVPIGGADVCPVNYKWRDRRFGDEATTFYGNVIKGLVASA